MVQLLMSGNQEVNVLVIKLITEFNKFSVQELHDFKLEWEKELISRERDQQLIDLCKTIVDAVIIYKSEESVDNQQTINEFMKS